jgi:hypothetical protein
MFEPSHVSAARWLPSKTDSRLSALGLDFAQAVEFLEGG